MIQNAEQEFHGELVPLALIAVETGEDVEAIAHRLGEAVQLDSVGMRAVPADVARQFFTERAEQTARMEERSRRSLERAAHESRLLAVGRPALEGAGPLESLVAEDPAFQTPAQEFGPGRGSVRQELLEQEFVESQRRRAEEIAAQQARKKAKRLLEEMEDESER